MMEESCMWGVGREHVGNFLPSHFFCESENVLFYIKSFKKSKLRLCFMNIVEQLQCSIKSLHCIEGEI